MTAWIIIYAFKELESKIRKLLNLWKIEAKVTAVELKQEILKQGY